MAITVGNSTQANSATVAKPAGVSTGDMVVAVVSGASASGVSIPGFTNQVELTGIAYCVALLTRILDGSEGSSWTASASSGSVQTNGALALTPGAGNTLVLDGTPSSNSAGNGSTATCPAITLANSGDVLVTGFVSTASGHTTPTGMTEVFDAGVFQGLSLDYETIASSGSTGTRASTTGGIRMVGVMLALKETTASSPATVNAVTATATAAMQTPSVSIDVIVDPPTLTATAQLLDPGVTAAATVSAPLLTATAAFLVPVVTGEVWIDAPLLTASAELLAPSVIAEAIVGDVPVLTSSAEFLTPFVGVAPPTVPWHGGQMQPESQTGVRGSVSARAGVTGAVRQRAGVTMKETP